MNELQRFDMSWSTQTEALPTYPLPRADGLYCYAADALALLEKEHAAHRVTDANLTGEIERLEEVQAQERAWMRRAYADLNAIYNANGMAELDLLADAPAWLKESGE